MDVDEKMIALVRRLQDGLFDVSDDSVAQMVREARNEALAEARTILKWLMVQTILEQATGVNEDTHSRSAHATGEMAGAVIPADASLVDEAPPPGAPAQKRGAEDEEQIRQEIEVIRQKIAENERVLSRAKASPVEAAPAASEGKVPAPLPAAGTLLDAPPVEEGQAGCAYYVYGIVDGDGGQPLEGLPGEGIDPACPVYALPTTGPTATASEAILRRTPPRKRPAHCAGTGYSAGRSTDQTLQAIVSQVSLRDFGQERLEENLDDMRWLEAKVRVHQDILDKVVASHTLIPMRFCTLYRSEERVQEMLQQHHADFVQALARLEGKREWGVKVYCDSQALAQRVDQVSDRVKELEAEMAAKSSGAAYFLKKKLEETIAAEVERITDEFAQRSHDCLSGCAAEAVISPLQGKELTGRQEAMVLNGAYLVAEDQLAAFRAELANLQDESGDLGFSYEMTGPWPAYNFAAIDLTDSETNCVEEGVAHE
jgi:hypothetical protein